MSSWPTGIETIKQLLAAGNLQKVSVPEAATAFLSEAAKHLDSGLTVAKPSLPTGRLLA